MGDDWIARTADDLEAKARGLALERQQAVAEGRAADAARLGRQFDSVTAAMRELASLAEKRVPGMMGSVRIGGVSVCIGRQKGDS